MNQDFTKKKSTICLKKKFVQRVSPEKKKSSTSSEQKKKFLQPKNFPLPPHHFSNGPSLTCSLLRGKKQESRR